MKNPSTYSYTLKINVYSKVLASAKISNFLLRASKLRNTLPNMS